ncbi:MAG: hypothetical protein JWP84_3739 [Tardiphaga sp.]|nr:hypothetical protein [Tardiphaga sp.]
MRPDIVIPVLMGCALLWWIGRGMGWSTRLVVAALTLLLIVGILLLERSLQ